MGLSGIAQNKVLYGPHILAFKHSGLTIAKNKDKLFKIIKGHFDSCINGISVQDIIDVKSSDSGVIYIDSNYKTTLKDAGVCYLEVTVGETTYYKSCVMRLPCIVYPAGMGGMTSSPQNICNKKGKLKKNTMTFGFSCNENMSGKLGKTSKCKIEIATDRQFKNIIKSYDLPSKYFNNCKEVKINNLKKAKFKKNKYYYIRGYTYKNINNAVITSWNYQWSKFKINSKWKVISSWKNKDWGFENDFVDNVEDENALLQVISDYKKFDYIEFDNLYKK